MTSPVGNKGPHLNYTDILQTIEQNQNLPSLDHSIAKNVKNILPSQVLDPSTFISVDLSDRVELVGEEASAEELEEVLGVYENEVEKELKNLKRNEIKQKLIKGLMEPEEWAKEQVSDTKDLIHDVIDYLETLVPLKFLENFALYEHFDEIKQYSGLAALLASAIDDGADGLALIFKSKILSHSRQLFDKVEKRFNNQLLENNSPYSLKEQEEIKSSLATWKKNIAAEEIKLKQQKILYGLGLSKTVLGVGKYILKVLPETEGASLIGTLKSTFLVPITWVVSSLGLFLYSIAIYKATKNRNIYLKWTKDFQTWQKNTNFFSSDPNALPSQKDENYDFIIENSTNLLQKRMALSQKKISLLDPQFDQLRPKIEELKKQSFNLATTRIQESLEELQNMFISTNVPVQDPAQEDQFKKELMTRILYRMDTFLDQWTLSEDSLSFSSYQELVSLTDLRDELKSSLEAIPFATTENLEEKLTHLTESFNDWNQSEEKENFFQIGMQAQTKESLLSFYADHQETLEIPVKNALKALINKKHSIENRFGLFKITQTRLLFSLAVITFAVSVTLAILGLITLPFGGAGLIFIILAAASLGLNLGLTGAGYWLAFRDKPRATLASFTPLAVRLLFTNAVAKIHAYSTCIKQKKLQDVAQIIYDLKQKNLDEREKNYSQALVDFQKAKQTFEESQKKVNKWNERLKQLEHHQTQIKWADFASSASLKIQTDPGFDSLIAFNEALKTCDFQLLSAETKALLKVQLGLDLEKLQKQLSKDPQNKENIKNTLQKFFTLEDGEFVAFIKNQQQQAA